MIKVTGLNETIKGLGAAGELIRKAAANGVFATAQQVRNTAINSIQSQSQGRVVTRQSQGGNEYEHTASKPGDAPNTDTGALVRSISVEPQMPDLEMFVGSGIEYAPFLEYGTKRMAPRPWLQPAVDANAKKLKSNIETQIQRATK